MTMLSGMRVLDLGSFITGPYAASLLAEWGADVIKVERPGTGDPFRRFERKAGVPDPADLYAAQFLSHNRNKRSITLDITTAAGAAVLEKLIISSDVLIINSRPGVPERLGIGYEAVRELNPRIVYCDITGFGRSGPYANRPAFDNVGQALSGWSSRYRREGDARVVGPTIADPITSYFAVMGILAALVDRERTGEGHRVELNLLEPLVMFTMEPIMHYLTTGGGVDVYYRASMSQAYTVTCKDGFRIGLHPGAVDKFWDSLAHAINRPDLIDAYPTRASRIANYQTIADEINGEFGQKTRAEWLEILATVDTPFAPERTVEDVVEDPQIKHLGTFYETWHPRFGRTVAPHRPVLVDGSRDIEFRPAPALGEHTDDILAEYGYTPEQVAELRASGVIEATPSEG